MTEVPNVKDEFAPNTAPSGVACKVYIAFRSFINDYIIGNFIN